MCARIFVGAFSAFGNIFGGKLSLEPSQVLARFSRETMPKLEEIPRKQMALAPKTPELVLWFCLLSCQVLAMFSVGNVVLLRLLRFLHRF